jgi:putative MATE family efflux protein
MSHDTSPRPAPSPASPAQAARASHVAKAPMAARTKMLLEAPILPTLLRLSFPNVLNLLALAGMITFDGLFLGRLGADALVGVSLVFPFVMFVQHIAASGLGGAVASAISRALGAGQQQKADALAAHAFVLTIIVATTFSALMLGAGPLIYQSMGGRGAALDAALAYSSVVFGGAISVWLLNILGNVVRGTGNMSLPAQVLVASVLGHALLSPLLIFGWGPVPALGPAGAGWGLVLSFAAGSMVLWRHLRSGRALVSLRLGSRGPKGTRYQWSLFKEILRVGVPGMANVAINNLTVIILTGIAGHLGQASAVGYAMGARLEYIMIPLAFGFGTALLAMIGTNWGAGQFQRARRIAWTGALTVSLFCGTVGVFFALAPALWMGLFTADGETARVGTLYLQIVAPFYAVYGAGMALYYFMQGVGHIVPAVLANAVRLAASAGGAYAAITWFDAGPVGIFAAIAASFVLYGALVLWAFLRTRDPSIQAVPI